MTNTNVYMESEGVSFIKRNLHLVNYDFVLLRFLKAIV